MYPRFLIFANINEKILATSYQASHPFDKHQFLFEHLEKGIAIPTSLPPFDTLVFYDKSKKSISVICTIIGLEKDNVVDDVILGILLSLALAPRLIPPKFDICSFLAEAIHGQLEKLPTI